MSGSRSYKTFRLENKICEMAEKKMQAEHRKGSLNSYLEELLDKYFSGLLIDWERERPRLELELMHSIESRRVNRIGPARVTIDNDERKRQTG